MVYVPEEHRPSSKPSPSTSASNRRRWKVVPPARAAAILLLLVWVGPVTFAQTDSWQLVRWVGAPGPASAESRVIPAGKAILLELGTPLKLILRDGSALEGRFLGRTLLDSALYAPRFAARAPSSPFALGETLHVSLHDGRELTAPFSGYGELALLLRSPDGPQPLRVPFESASAIRRANGDSVEASALARAFRANTLPSAEALVLEQRLPMVPADRWVAGLRVAMEDIEWAIAELPSRTAQRSSGMSVAGIVVLSVVVSVVVVFVVLGMAVKSAERSCQRAWPYSKAQALPGVHLTTRPFDRSRGCYLDDPLAVADPWPGLTEGGPATAMADPATSAALAPTPP